MSESRDVVHAQIDALEAQLRLALVQCQALRHALATAAAPPAPPRAQEELPSRPETCAGVDPEACGLCDEGARLSRATFATPHAWACRGCRVTFTERSPSS